MDDPYRSSQQVGTCPRCSNMTESDGFAPGRLTCLRGCGEWYPSSSFKTEQWSAITIVGRALVGASWPWGPAMCPMCNREMNVGQKGDVRFDFCSMHGLWLDAGEAHRFAQAFTNP